MRYQAIRLLLRFNCTPTRTTTKSPFSTAMQPPSTPRDDDSTFHRVQHKVYEFYEEHTHRIKASHGLSHVLAVLRHANCAISCHRPKLSLEMGQNIKMATLLHDVDDHKYFPDHQNHQNARFILDEANVSEESTCIVLYMIDLVSCSANGNHVPANILQKEDYHLLIPRWSDRLEAVSSTGVVRSYQYNQEHGQPLWGPHSPTARTVAQVWEFATPERFEQYQERNGTSEDMISLLR